ncbi:MAG: polysaccharide biosynthesis C-terminal domain-containing protein [Bacteroidales bacterium]|nr:polysaccharide biosynthesis C-terminal domain-containing protein [Bacteroidales bacterium]
MSQIQKLAGQTAIYGLSSIIGRLLNYLLVPIHTRVFVTSDFGTISEMYAYVAFLIVILTYGMETTFFRFSVDNDKKSVFSTSLISLFVTSFFFVAISTIFAQPIATAIRYPNNSEYIVYFALIVSLDALSAVPFAKLRQENKAKKFVVVKVLGIGVNIFFNLFFLLLCPYLYKHNIMPDFVSLVYKGKVGVGYVFISNLISSIATIIILLPDMIKINFKFDFSLWKKMMPYALPLLVVGLAGNVNETMDRILLKYLLPRNISMHELGIYGACYKISIMMTIFIQAFRFAAEPFFFSNSQKENAKNLYADVMKYFVIICSFIFLVITLYIDIVKYFIGEDYFSGLKIVPILLLANMFLGIYFNLSIWYKLTDKTKYGSYLSIFGAVITLVLNFIFIPVYGYMASAWATFLCYFSMMVVSYFIGQKYYKIPYNLIKITGYLLFAVLIYGISYFIFEHFKPNTLAIKLLVNTLLLGVFAIVVFMFERKMKPVIGNQ